MQRQLTCQSTLARTPSRNPLNKGLRVVFWMGGFSNKVLRSPNGLILGWIWANTHLNPALSLALDTLSPRSASQVAVGGGQIGQAQQTDGENWNISTNWLSDAPLGEWASVYTNDDGRVTILWLGGNGLRGEIPAELGSLSNLRYGWTSASNALSGEIPAWLGSLSNLTASGPQPDRLERVRARQSGRPVGL